MCYETTKLINNLKSVHESLVNNNTNVNNILKYKQIT